MKGYHVTNLAALRSIRLQGLKGFRFEVEELATSFTPLKTGRLYRDGWVFCYPSLEIARWAVESGMFGPEPKILLVEGEGKEFFHIEDSEIQMAICGKKAAWEIIQ